MKVKVLLMHHARTVLTLNSVILTSGQRAE